MVSAGSSPLARGLLHPFGGATFLDRIIPARAGFTVPKTVPIMLLSDHPRSRGVYRNAEIFFRESSGSSPLARGLLQNLIHGRVNRRIIPARAGFTVLPIPVQYSSVGSSPLARGLHLAIGVIPTVGHPTRGRSPSLVT